MQAAKARVLREGQKTRAFGLSEGLFCVESESGNFRKTENRDVFVSERQTY